MLTVVVTATIASARKRNFCIPWSNGNDFSPAADKVISMMDNRLLCSGIVLAAIVAAGCHGTEGPKNIEAATLAISSDVPKGWTVVESQDDQVPQGHYWGDSGVSYRGPRGRHLVVAGLRPKTISWRAAGSECRMDVVFAEALDIWIMPAAYREDWWSRLNPYAPVHPAIVFEGRDVIVFAMPTLWVTDRAHLDRVLASATETWPAECPPPNVEVSWATWRNDLSQILQN